LLKKVRNDLKLKSTFFSISEKDGYVVFTGRGFGHGVGLSQEGAMRMAKLGYNYKDILHYYYNDIHLIPLAALNFFKTY
jgi:stage II sporulation protein D